MSPATFPTSPAARGEERKFINPTAGFVGANKFGPDGKPTAVPVEPGGEVWLTPEEERMTAEAPRAPQDNPFIKAWEEPVEFDSFGEPVRSITRQGILVLSEEPPRPVASDRYIPERGGIEEVRAAREAMEGLSQVSDAELEAELAKRREAEPSEPEPEVKGAEVPSQPPVEGQPSPDEVVGTPEAPAANDTAVAQRKPTREQPTRAIPT